MERAEGGDQKHPPVQGPRLFTPDNRDTINAIPSFTQLPAPRRAPRLPTPRGDRQHPTHFRGSSWSLSMLSASLSGSPRHVWSTVSGSCSPSLQLSSSGESSGAEWRARPAASAQGAEGPRELGSAACQDTSPQHVGSRDTEQGSHPLSAAQVCRAPFFPLSPLGPFFLPDLSDIFWHFQTNQRPPSASPRVLALDSHLGCDWLRCGCSRRSGDPARSWRTNSAGTAASRSLARGWASSSAPAVPACSDGRVRRRTRC